MKRKNTYVKKSAKFWDYSPTALVLTLLVISIYNYSSNDERIIRKFHQEFSSEKKVAKRFFGKIFYEDSYIESTEQPHCSDARTTTDITTHRVVKCGKLRNLWVKEAEVGKEKDPEESYIRFLSKYRNGCDVYLGPVANRADRLYAFFDCNIKLTKINNEDIERSWNSFFEEEFPGELIAFDDESVSISTNTGGDINDGKFRFTFEK